MAAMPAPNLQTVLHMIFFTEVIQFPIPALREPSVALMPFMLLSCSV